MELFYINLADQAARRADLEAGFAAHAAPGWNITRVEAVTAAAAADAPGPIRDAEKACFLSHIRVLLAARATPGHIFIAEDDIRFGKQSLALVDRAAAALPDPDWDILFADLVIPHPRQMIQLLRQRRTLAPGQFQLVPLGEFAFGGSMAYVVHAASREKLLGLLAQDAPMDLPYDLHLRRLIGAGALRARMIFPFPVTQSALGAQSQIQAENRADTVWTAFRRLAWAERDIGEAVAPLGEADAELDALGRILAAMARADFVPK